MCDIHVHIDTYSNIDPTRTLTLRNSFVAGMRRRFTELTKVIQQAIVDNDCFGLEDINVQQMEAPMRKQFAFPTTQKKVEEFMVWLNRQVDRGVLEIGVGQQLGTAIRPAWTNMYVYDSYKRGIIRSNYEMRKVGYNIPTIENRGGIDAVMNTPFHMDRVGILYARGFNQLKGITAAMDTQISTVLGQGLIDGDNPRMLARKLVRVINGGGAELGLGRYMPARRRAEILARTEIIRAHHQAMVQEYRNWKVEGVNVIAEWRTAGDARVCPDCASMEAERFTLDQIENMIPRHPQCRCIAIPVEVGDDNK